MGCPARRRVRFCLDRRVSLLSICFSCPLFFFFFFFILVFPLFFDPCSFDERKQTTNKTGSPVVVADQFHQSGAARFCPSDKSAHVSAHNAVRTSVSASAEARFNKELGRQFLKAQKRAAQKGRSIPSKREYHDHWGYVGEIFYFLNFFSIFFFKSLFWPCPSFHTRFADFANRA